MWRKPVFSKCIPSYLSYFNANTNHSFDSAAIPSPTLLNQILSELAKDKCT
jgi:hypothetical protein